MSLKARISEDMKTAMKARETDRLAAIRLLMAAIKQKEVDERIDLDDAAVVQVVDKLIKQRKDSIAAYQQAQRPDLAAKEQAEMTVLLAYLPARLSDEEIRAAVRRLVDQVAADLGRALTGADMGRVMGLAKAQLAGQADMGVVSAALKAALNPA